MSQKSQEFTPSFPYSDILEEDVQQEIFQNVGSQEMDMFLNGNLNGYDNNGPYMGEIYNNGNSIHDERTMSLEDIKVFSFAPNTTSQLLPLAGTEVLSTEEYLGPHEFEVSVLPNYRSKNPWVYSATLNKIFMDINQQFPVDFKIKNRPSNGQLFIRTTPQYSAQHYAAEPVTRCIQHDHIADLTNKDVSEEVRKHVIRCSNKSSEYIGNPSEAQRLSIVFPLSEPQVGNESVREMFHFVCKSSCPAPGMNRRGIEVIFTLEDQHGTVLGRNCLKVRICACPKRDKEKEENEANKTNNPEPRGKKRKADLVPPANPRKVLAQQEDLKVFTLNMHFTGKQNLLDILTYAEKVYLAKAYELQGRPEEQVMKNNILEIQEVKKQLQ